MGGFLAIGLSLSSLCVLQRTSVLMFMAFGALKEVLTVCFSVLIYGDVITTNSVFGMVLVLMGVVLYKYHRHSRSHQHQETTELSPSIRNNVAYEVASSINSGVNGRSPSSQVVKKDNNGPPTNPMEKKSLLDPQSRTSFDEM
uniref:Sugar phosphate transporter domain-containing protein n=1 Tax=Bigelowiella natans TaxID=227086 RepID=A0A7S2P4F2_BIGNA|mmetsp:Transcript_1805/g.2692  ORF Transcript_1805/g.2692 Transcript_1805/m.2692 type:complete len:143 (+) Transcript_1805:130-558(+)